MSLFQRASAFLKALCGFFLAVAVASGTGLSVAQAPPAKLDADVLIFKNGDQLTGTLVRGAGSSITFKSDMAGEITVSLDKVKELRAHATFAVLKKDIPLKTRTIQANVEPGKIAYSDGALRVDTVSGTSSSVPEDKLAFLIDKPTFDKTLQPQSLLRGWRGAVTGSATKIQSTNFGNTFNLNLNLVRAAPLVSYLAPHDRQIFNLSETYGKLTQPLVPQTSPATPDSIAKTSIFHGDFEFDRYFSPRFYTLADTSFDHNFAQGLNLQQVFGAGFGWTPVQRPTQQLDLKFDVHYEKQEFLPGAANVNQNLIGSTFAESYRRVLPLKLVLTENGNVLPSWNNPNAYSANGAVNLALPTIHRLTVNLGATDSFLNNPLPGYQKNSFQFTTGIGYTFQ